MSTTEQAPQEQQQAEQIQQDQLFNTDEYDLSKLAEQEAQAAEREAQGRAVLATVDPQTAGEKVRLTKPLPEDEAEATKAAYDLLWKADGEVPKEIAVERDWGDNQAEHNEKQEAHVAAVAEVLASKLAAHEKVSASRQKTAEKRQQIADQKAANEARDAKSAETIAARADYDAKRQELRDEYTAKQRLQMGTNQADLFSTEIARDADKYAVSVLHPERNNDKNSVVDTADLKAEKWNQTPANQVKNAQTKEALNDFYKGFADKEFTGAETGETKEAMEQEPGIRRISYKPNGEGVVDLAVEFTEKGVNIKLEDLKSHKPTGENGEEVDAQCVLITTEETDEYPASQFYAYDDVITDLMHMAKFRNDKGEWIISDEMADQTQLSTGQPLIRNGKVVSGPISKFLVEMPSTDVDELDDSWEATDEESPFKLAEALMDSVEDELDAADANEVSETVAEVLTPPALEDDPALMQDRSKRMMGWASKALKRVKEAPLSVLIRTQRAIGSAVEHFTDKEKGRKRIVGAVLGSVALGATAYLGLKFGLAHHTADVQPSGSGGSGGMNPDLADLAGRPSSMTPASELLPVAPSGGGSSAAEHVRHLQHGQTVSDFALDDLKSKGRSLDQSNILARTQQILDQNHMSWEQARHLADKTAIKV